MKVPTPAAALVARSKVPVPSSRMTSPLGASAIAYGGDPTSLSPHCDTVRAVHSRRYGACLSRMRGDVHSAIVISNCLPLVASRRGVAAPSHREFNAAGRSVWAPRCGVASASTSQNPGEPGDEQAECEPRGYTGQAEAVDGVGEVPLDGSCVGDDWIVCGCGALQGPDLPPAVVGHVAAGCDQHEAGDAGHGRPGPA